MLTQQKEWQQVFGEPSPAFDARVRQTLNHLEEEKPMKRFTFRTAALVLALMIILMGVVYAATGLWTVADYFNNRFGDTVNAPKDFDSGFTGDYTLEVDDLTFHIQDAFVEAGTLNAIVEVRRADGQPALFRGEDCMEDDPLGCLYIDDLPDPESGEMTVAEYAEARNLPLYWVELSFRQEGVPENGAGDFWMEGDKQLAYFVSAEDVQAENGQAIFQWVVYLHADDGTLHSQSLDITLPIESLTVRTAEVNQQVEGLPVMLDSVTLSQGRMGLYLDYAWHIEESLGMPEMAEALKHDDINLWFRCVDPATGKELPGGPTINGGVSSQDDVHYLQRGDSLRADFAGDTLWLCPYDAWEKQTFGIITVKIR